MKRVLVVLVGVLLTLVMVVKYDAELSDSARALLDQAKSDGDSPAYLYALGLAAGEGEEPAALGRRLLDHYHAVAPEDFYEDFVYEKAGRLSLPESELFCAPLTRHCLRAIFTSDYDVESLVAEHRILVDRLERFHAFDEFETLAQPAAHMPFLPFTHIARAERLRTLIAVSHYRAGDAEKAVDLLLDQAIQIRRALALQDNLIGKMVFLSQLSNTIDVASIILAQVNIPIDPVSKFSQSEKSFDDVMAMEFAFAHHIAHDFLRNPEAYEENETTPTWLFRMFYKPNMSMNALTPLYYRAQDLARLSPADFAREMEAAPSKKYSSVPGINYFGNQFLADPPFFEEYIGRMMDLDAKLSLFNQLYHLKRQTADIDNPYYPGDAPIFSEEKLCFRGPLEDKKGFRCIRTAL